MPIARRGGAEVGGLSDGGGPRSEEFPGGPKRNTRCRIVAEKKEQIYSARRLPGLAVKPTGRRSASSRGSVDLFRDWQEITNSILCGSSERAETANGCLVLQRVGTTAERPQGELKNRKELVPALLRSASGELLPS